MMNAIAIFSNISKTSHRLLRRIHVASIQNVSDAIPVQKISNEQNDNEHDRKYDESIKKLVLSASLPFVLEFGWSREALVAGAETAGYPGVIHGLYLHGGADLIKYFGAECNKKLSEQMKKEVEESKDFIPTDFVKRAVESRLRMNIPYMPRWPQALAIMTLPANVPHALATLLTVVDDICYYAGDRSVDFTWYARRIGLAGIYKSTELYMVQDKSDNYNNTWEFLSRHLKELVLIHDSISKMDSVGLPTKDTLSAAFTTARNIMGINWNR